MRICIQRSRKLKPQKKYNLFRMFSFDKKQNYLKQQNLDHSFIEKVLVVIKERVDNSQKENFESAEDERYLRILKEINSDLDKKILEIGENVKSLASQISLKI